MSTAQIQGRSAGSGGAEQRQTSATTGLGRLAILRHIRKSRARRKEVEILGTRGIRVAGRTKEALALGKRCLDGSSHVVGIVGSSRNRVARYLLPRCSAARRSNQSTFTWFVREASHGYSGRLQRHHEEVPRRLWLGDRPRPVCDCWHRRCRVLAGGPDLAGAPVLGISPGGPVLPGAPVLGVSPGGPVLARDLVASVLLAVRADALPARAQSRAHRKEVESSGHMEIE